MNIFDPQGPVAAAEKTILIDSIAIMLAIVVPTIVAILAFAYWFRQSNPRAQYLPDFAYSGRLELVVWSIPTLTVILLGGVAWIGSHQLDPAARVEGTGAPVRIQVVSLDWKWLFIYPDLRVATVNSLTVPVGAPLRFELTSASVMNVFFVPQLGSMIYSMAGMVSQLHLQADKPGEYLGMSAQFSGEGFPTMTFKVKAVPPADYAKWLADTLTSNAPPLDAAAYAELAKPSEAVPPKTYTPVERGLFDLIIDHTVRPPATAAAQAASAFWAWCGQAVRSREGI